MLRRIAGSLVPSATVSLIPTGGSSVRYHHYRGVTADDPMGEKASWDSHPGIASRGSGTIDAEAFENAMEEEAHSGRHFGEGQLRGKHIMKAAYGAAMNTKGIKSKAEAAGAYDGLDAEEIEDRKADMRHQRTQDRERHLMARNYSSYEEFAAKELAAQGGAEDDGDDDDEEDAEDAGEEGDDEEAVAAADGLDARSKAGAAAPPNTTGIPASLRTDAPREAYEFRQAGVSKADDVRYTDSSTPVKDLVMSDNPAATVGKDADDPLHWDTDDVVDWLTHYAPESMDESMESAFRMVRVDGDMLLNRVTVPVLFKEMRRWHVKQKKGEFYEPKLSEQIIQEAVYMCYPYCRF